MYPITRSAAVAVGLAVSCAACSSSGSPAQHTGTGAPATSASRTATVAAGSGSAGSGAGIRMTGAFTATADVTLCAAGGGSIAVHVAGDSETFRGVISGKAFGFVGPAAADYTLKAGQPLPSVSADGTSFTVRGAVLIDLVSGRSVTATGTVSCP